MSKSDLINNLPIDEERSNMYENLYNGLFTSGVVGAAAAAVAGGTIAPLILAKGAVAGMFGAVVPGGLLGAIEGFYHTSNDYTCNKSSSDNSLAQKVKVSASDFLNGSYLGCIIGAATAAATPAAGEVLLKVVVQGMFEGGLIGGLAGTVIGTEHWWMPSVYNEYPWNPIKYWSNCTGVHNDVINDHS
jgi:hypothetical protein